MFGYVTINRNELSDEDFARYRSYYCGLCRALQKRHGFSGQLILSYDMVFLEVLLTSLYEYDSQSGTGRCVPHPTKTHTWLYNAASDYCADMSVALSYYNLMDNWEDDHSAPSLIMAKRLRKRYEAVSERYPRQCGAVRDCIGRLSELEKAGCANPDEPAGAFGAMMAQLLTVADDLWAPTLRQLGDSLGRFIYLLDAALDYDKDKRKGKYNPYLAMGTGKDWPRWEEYLVLTMGRATAAFEKLPLVQDKALLDNILYSGVWVGYRGRRKEEEPHHD